MEETLSRREAARIRSEAPERLPDPSFTRLSSIASSEVDEEEQPFLGLRTPRRGQDRRYPSWTSSPESRIEVNPLLTSRSPPQTSGPGGSASAGAAATSSTVTKWRGGQPPPPPALSLSFAQAASEPHAFRQWTRRVQAWQIRVAQWAPPEEHALMLLEVITGDPAMVLQEESIARLHQADGLQHLLTRLRVLEEQPVQSVGGAMKEYESIRRAPEELIRAFLARFLKVEQRMSRVGLTPFTDEARGWKLLHSCMLTGHDMRNVLTAAGNKYEFDAIRRALELQFPGVPPTHAKAMGPRKGKDGGKGGKNGKPPQRQVYTAEQPQEEMGQMAAAAAADGEEGDQQQHQDAWQPEDAAAEEHVDNAAEGVPAEGQYDPDIALMEAAEVLSVTANRLKSITQNRGWKGFGKDGKDNQKGHRYPSANYPIFTKGKDGYKGKQTWHGWGNSGKGKGTYPSTSTSTSSYPPRPQHQVQQTEWTGMDEVSDDWWQAYLQEETAPGYQTYVASTGRQQDPTTVRFHQIGWQVDAVQHPSSTWSELVVLDTACQRSVAGLEWMQAWEKAGGLAIRQAEKETFRFGVGHAVSEVRCSCPAHVADQDSAIIVFNVSLVKVHIPFLLSRHGLETLGACIDLAEQVVVFRVNNQQLRIPLLKAGGHLAIGVRPAVQELQGNEQALKQDVQIPSETFATGVTKVATASPQVAHAFQHCQAKLMGHSLPLAHGRTNVIDAMGSSHLRSLTVGAYTTRGFGVTQATKQQIGLVACLHTLASTQPKKVYLPYLTCTVSSGQASLHVDSNNEGLSVTISLGNFTGGELEIGGVPVKTHHQWCQFDPKVPHRVLPYDGQRVSITFYAPRNAAGLLTQEHFRVLEKHGFPVKEWWIHHNGPVERTVMSSIAQRCCQCASTTELAACPGLGSTSCKQNCVLCGECRWQRSVCHCCISLSSTSTALSAQEQTAPSNELPLQRQVGQYATTTSSSRASFSRHGPWSTRRAKANGSGATLERCHEGDSYRLQHSARVDDHAGQVVCAQPKLDSSTTPLWTGSGNGQRPCAHAIHVPDRNVITKVCSAAVIAGGHQVRAEPRDLSPLERGHQVRSRTSRDVPSLRGVSSSLAMEHRAEGLEATSDGEGATHQAAGGGRSSEDIFIEHEHKHQQSTNRIVSISQSKPQGQTSAAGKLLPGRHGLVRRSQRCTGVQRRLGKRLGQGM
eukprot:940900-Amphidinium_carterae.1